MAGERRRTRKRAGQQGAAGADNQITCTHCINYQSGRDCATPTEGASRVGKGCYTSPFHREGERKIVRDLDASSDPATVIFPSCVGVRGREFTPLVPGMTRCKGGYMCLTLKPTSTRLEPSRVEK